MSSLWDLNPQLIARGAHFVWLLVDCAITRFFLFAFSIRYASIRAIETRNTADDQQWLTYWVLYSMLTLFELTFYTLVDWIPFCSYLKLIITCWLVIPQFSGATYVYQHYVRPFYTGDQTVNIWYVPSKKDDLTRPIPTQDDILVTGDKYIHEYRPDETIQYANFGGEVNYRGNAFFSEDDYVY